MRFLRDFSRYTLIKLCKINRKRSVKWVKLSTLIISLNDEKCVSNNSNNSIYLARTKSYLQTEGYGHPLNPIPPLKSFCGIVKEYF